MIYEEFKGGLCQFYTSFSHLCPSVLNAGRDVIPNQFNRHFLFNYCKRKEGIKRTAEKAVGCKK